MFNKKNRIFVFCALPCEAKSLIRTWQLNKHPQKHLIDIYTNADRIIAVTGTGKSAMAGAIGYTMALFSTHPTPILINFGIAGHQSHTLGSLYLADKVVDFETGKRFYPQTPFSYPYPKSHLITRSTPETSYPEKSLYDMEASAFYEIAIKFSSSELIHCLKVVSDNRNFPINGISETYVERWCADQLNIIDNFVDQLLTLQQSTPDIKSKQYNQILNTFHFSATNCVKLKALLHRWQILSADEVLHWEKANCRNAREFLIWLESQLDNSKFVL